jgi:hypothetical protein
VVFGSRRPWQRYPAVDRISGEPEVSRAMKKLSPTGFYVILNVKIVVKTSRANHAGTKDQPVLKRNH